MAPAPHAAQSYVYLGPSGTFTEAALHTLPEAATRELLPLTSVPAALDAVRRGEAAAAFVALENSVEGPVPGTLDELAGGEPLTIFREVLLPIEFALLARPGTEFGDIKTVTGHPVAQSQVRRWLGTELPDAEWESAASNADGARMVSEGRYDAAFAGEFAAAQYGLVPLRTGINDAASATTRFVLVGRPGRPPARTGSDRSTVAMWLAEDHPGALLELLQQFAVRGVNMSRIESRPTGEGLGRYYFIADFDGHIDDLRVGEALMGLHRICPKVRFLGSYPRADRAEPRLGQGTSDAEFRAAHDWLANCRDGRA
ncbi:prephenate dehydratase [Mangrovactinospora gilvigrisea]|uniref:Prephenate dehydratase n=1 Tax=Mangrovactinospora gilvigrisea TaxID=1428644 RepID=A0A1J7CAC4_9ACTN|nr:prephenate dehydratase [Mangrovactinospora gilvigrisea]OIV38464.1 prephenate dehydratase [Mangrovactinospora gilvigrisea]